MEEAKESTIKRKSLKQGPFKLLEHPVIEYPTEPQHELHYADDYADKSFSL